METFPFNHIWNFIKDSLINFNNTIYSKHLLQENKFDNINLKNELKYKPGIKLSDKIIEYDMKLIDNYDRNSIKVGSKNEK